MKIGGCAGHQCNATCPADARARIEYAGLGDAIASNDSLGRISCLVLVIASDQDYTPVEWKRRYAAAIPGAQVVVLHDSRHVAPLDQPSQFNRMVMEFLGKSRMAGDTPLAG